MDNLVRTGHFRFKDTLIFSSEQYVAAVKFLNSLEIGSVIQIRNLLFIKMYIYSINVDLVKTSHVCWSSLIPIISNRHTIEHNNVFSKEFLSGSSIILRQDIQSLIQNCK